MMYERLTPLPYQREGVQIIEQGNGPNWRPNRAILADDMGLGKTLQLLHWLRRCKTGQRWPALVVCPAPIKKQWAQQAAAQIGVQGIICEGRRPPSGGFFSKPQLAIINYDILPTWKEALKGWGLQSIVLDECQRVQNREAKQTQAIVDLCQGVPGIVPASGTPLTNRPVELWNMVHLLRPDIFPGFLDYATTYCKPTWRPWGVQWHGAQNLDQLNKILLSSMMIRRVKEDVLDQLPDKIRQVVPVELSDPAQYQFAKTDFLKWLKIQYGANSSRAKKASKAERLAQVGYMRQLAAKLKVRAVARWIDEFLANTDEKMVLFCVHRKMIECMTRHYAGQCTHIDGTVTGNARAAAVDRFVNDPKCRLIFGNIRAMGQGIDGLQHAARNVAFIELDWRPGDHTQAEDRLFRMGQKWHVWVYYLVAGSTIEERLCEIIQEKQAVLNAVLNGQVSTTDDLGIMDLLIERMAEEEGMLAA